MTPSRRSPVAIVGLVVAFVAAMAGLSLLRGVVLQQIWAWFVADTFDITTLTLVQAIGLSLVVSFLTYQYDARKAGGHQTVGEILIEGVVAGLVYSGFAFFMAAIVHSFA